MDSTLTYSKANFPLKLPTTNFDRDHLAPMFAVGIQSNIGVKGLSLNMLYSRFGGSAKQTGGTNKFN